MDKQLNRTEFLQSKIDRAFTNQRWVDLWPGARLEFQCRTCDHKAMIVTISQAEKTKLFRLFNSWLEDPSYIELVRTGLSKQTRVQTYLSSNTNLKPETF